MKILYLVRHGDREKRVDDVGLTDLGKRQSMLLGTYLSQVGIDLIVSSPLKRAVETASIVVQSIGVKFEIDSTLRERVSYGDIPHQPYGDFLKMCEYSSIHRDYLLPNGESSFLSGRRMEKFISKTLSLPEAKVLIVTHGGIITDYLRNVFSPDILELSYSKFLEKREMCILPCSITTVAFIGKKPKLVQIGFDKHLDKIKNSTH